MAKKRAKRKPMVLGDSHPLADEYAAKLLNKLEDVGFPAKGAFHASRIYSAVADLLVEYGVKAGGTK